MSNTLFAQIRWITFSVVSCTLLTVLLFCLITSAEAASPKALAQEAEVNFSQAAYTISEDTEVGFIALTISPVITTPISLIVSSANIQAEAAKDFVGFRQSLLITNTDLYTLAISILDDNFVEGDEQFRLTISPLQGGTVGPIAETIITIVENDIAYLGIADVEVSETAGMAAVIISQSLTSTLESLVSVRTLDGTAIATKDYAETETKVSIFPDTRATTVWIPIYDNVLATGPKTFTVMLEEAIHAQIAVPTATVTILDEEILPTLMPHPAEAIENSEAITFVVTLSESWSQTVTVEYATTDGSAIAAQDYLSQTGVLMFSPGVLTTTVTIALLEGEIDEPAQNFYLLFHNPVQAILSRTEVEGMINTPSPVESLFLPVLAR